MLHKYVNQYWINQLVSKEQTVSERFYMDVQKNLAYTGSCGKVLHHLNQITAISLGP